MARRVALIVGINQYDKKMDLKTLSAPVNDANALYDLLKQYSDFQLIPLPKGQKDKRYFVRDVALSSTDFLTEFQGIFSHDPTVAPEEVVLFFSGHGTRKEELSGAISCLAFSDNKHAFSLQELCKAIEKSAVKRVVLMLDCCHSGQAHAFFEQLQGKQFCLIAACSENNIVYGSTRSC